MAHPDDESLGVGGSLAKYSREGIGTYLLTATRGERGRFGDAAESPGLEIVGRTREAELRAAAAVLGVREVSLLGYVDGALDRAEPGEAVSRIARHIRRIRPQVVLTFGPEGGYGHPDHVAICQFTTAAVVRAADASAPGPGLAPHAVSKLYYMESSRESWDIYQRVFKKLVSFVDGREREAAPWPEWAITTSVDASEHWRVVWDAVQCHRTQLTIYSRLGELSEADHARVWGRQQFYRAFSLVNGGRARESDLFEGLR